MINVYLLTSRTLFGFFATSDVEGRETLKISEVQRLYIVRTIRGVTLSRSIRMQHLSRGTTACTRHGSSRLAPRIEPVHWPCRLPEHPRGLFLGNSLSRRWMDWRGTWRSRSLGVRLGRRGHWPYQLDMSRYGDCVDVLTQQKQTWCWRKNWGMHRPPAQSQCQQSTGWQMCWWKQRRSTCVDRLWCRVNEWCLSTMHSSKDPWESTRIRKKR